MDNELNNSLDKFFKTQASGLNNYLDEYNKAQANGDILGQFRWLSEITDSLYHDGKVDELIYYLHVRFQLARKTNRLDQELMAMIALKNLYYYVLKNDQEALRWAEKIHDFGTRINTLKDKEDITFIRSHDMLYHQEALRLINELLRANEEMLPKMKIHGSK